jgi:hypothetical protein
MGTVTPNPQWLAMCSRCMPTGTPFPTATSVFPSATPLVTCVTPAGGGEEVCYTATETLIPTVTSTVTPTATFSPYVNFSVRYSEVGGSYNTNIETSLVCEPVVGIKAEVHICTGTLSATDTSGGYISRIAHLINLDQTESIDHIPHYYYLVNTGGSFAYSTIRRISSNSVGDITADTVYVGSHEGIIYSSQYSGNILIKFYSSSSVTYTGAYTATYSFIVSTDPNYNPYLTPVPTATPDSSYCASIDDSDAESQFGLPVITGGTPVCGGAGGFIIPFSWFQLIGIQLDDLIIPYIEVCFVPTSFGILTIAGNAIDLDILAYILGALFLLSLVL